MGRTAEGRFQDAFLETMRSQGCICQKFNDLYSEGIFDTLIKFPHHIIVPGMGAPLRGAWVELKAFTEWPKRKTSHLPAKVKPTTAQIRWGRAFETDVIPCWFLIDTPDGWLIVEQDGLEALWALTIEEVKPLVTQGKVTIGRMLQGVRRG